MALAPPTAIAAPPANDNFANRNVLNLALPITFSSDTSEATLEPEDPRSYLSHPFTVWFEWTPPADGLYKLKIDRGPGNESTPAFSLGVVENGSADQRILVANANYYNETQRSPVYFWGTGGTAYQFLLGSAEGSVFDIELHATLAPTPGVVDLGNASPVDVARGAGFADTMQWTWTAPEDGLYVLDYFDGALEFATLPEFNVAPSAGGLPEPLFPDYWFAHASGSGFHYFKATAGSEFLIGTPTPEVRFTLERLPEVPNGVLSGAIDLGTTDTFTLQAHLAQGIVEPFEGNLIPQSWSLGSHWWKWRVPAPGLYRVTFQTARLLPDEDIWYPAEAFVFKGDTPETVTLLTTSPGWWQINLRNTRESTGSFVISASQAGEEFVIGLFNIIEGAGAYRPGQWQVELEPVPALVNDDFLDALTLIEDTGTVPFAGHFSSFEIGEPEPTSTVPEDQHWQGVGRAAPGSLWWKWTAPDDTPIEFRAKSDYYGDKGIFDIYTGVRLDNLQRVATFAESEDAEDKVIFPVAGQTYYLQLAGITINGDVEVVSRPDLRTSPDNDNFANAAPIDLAGENRINIEASCITATAEPGEPMPAARTRWWSWTADRDALVTFEYRRGSIAVYTGNSLPSLQRELGWGTGNVKHSSTSLRLRCTNGTTYHIAIDDDFKSLDRAQLSLYTYPLATPSNDALANRIALSSPIRHPGFQSVHNNYDVQSKVDDPNEPVATWPGARQTTWLSWTPEVASTTSFSLSAASNGSDSIPFGLDVYTLGARGQLVPFEAYTRDPPNRWPFWIIEGEAGVEYIIGVSSTREGSSASLQVHTTSQFVIEQEEWLGRFALPESETADDHDPAGDGIPNIVKRALGLSPLVHAYSGNEPNVGNLPKVERLPDGMIRLVYTVDPAYADNMRIHGEISESGRNWRGGGRSPISLGNNRYAIEFPSDERTLLVRLRFWSGS